jgi:hypothetical protein
LLFQPPHIYFILTNLGVVVIVTVQKTSKREKVGDEYKRYDDRINGVSTEVKWQFLKLIAEESGAKLDNVCSDSCCSVCLGEASSEVAHKCGHKFHKVCLDLLLSVRPGCPQCSDKAA